MGTHLTPHILTHRQRGSGRVPHLYHIALRQDGVYACLYLPGWVDIHRATLNDEGLIIRCRIAHLMNLERFRFKEGARYGQYS